MAALDVNMEIPAKLEPVFEGDARYRGAYGGRGSAKSTTFAKKLIERSLMRKTRVLCTREFQNSIKDSVIQLLIDQVEEMRVMQFFDFGESYFRCKLWDEEFIFKGLKRNIKEIKSMEGIDICWIEEAENTSEESFRVLLPTIRAVGSEVWLTWNPENEDAPVRQRFVLNPPERSKIVEINYVDNPWFPPELDFERRQDQKRDPDLYAHVWLGQCYTRSDAQVLAGKWRVDTFTMPEIVDGGPYYGVDWGFSSDPMALIRCWIKGNRLYIDYEAGGTGIEIKDMPETFALVPGIKQNITRADNARPELISHMNGEKFNVVGADKWPGSIEDGISHLRSYDEIVIHERCVNTAKEARLWSYKIDKLTGDVLPILVDKFNHWMDGLRYALAPIIKSKTFKGKPVYLGAFNHRIHISLDELWPVKKGQLVIGIARSSVRIAAVVMQMTDRGQLRILDELVSTDPGVGRFAGAIIKPLLVRKYRGFSSSYSVVSYSGRTAAGVGTQDTDQRALLDEVSEQGLKVDSCSSAALARRTEAVRYFLGQLAYGGQPAFSISPHCIKTVDGFVGGYQFKRMPLQDMDEIRYSTEPDQNQYTELHEAIQYGCLYMRESSELNDTQNIAIDPRIYG
jgi:phage terminase large subunit